MPPPVFRVECRISHIQWVRGCVIGLQAFNAVTSIHYHTGEPSDPPSQLHGEAARILGIKDEFRDEWHERLLMGLNPHTGERLPGMRDVGEKRCFGWDNTFNQHKGVSVAEGVGGDERIGLVRRNASRKAMGLFESQVGCEVYIDGKKTFRLTGNIVWGDFNHNSSRAGDPAGHQHAVVYNATWDAVDRKFRAAVTKRVDIATVNDLYNKELARGLRNLGYQAAWDGKEFTFKGVDRAVQEEFSQRNTQIKATQKALEAKIGKEMTPRAKGRLSVYNRPHKQAYVPIMVKRKGWLSRLTEFQAKAVAGLVKKAKLAVSMGKWGKGLERYAAKLMTQEIPGKEQERGIGR